MLILNEQNEVSHEIESRGYMIPQIPYHLPLSLFAGKKFLQNCDSLLQSFDLPRQRSLDLLRVTAQLTVKVLPIWGSRHGGTENWFDEHVVVGFERVAVGFTEGNRKLGRRIVDIVTKRLGSEIQSTGFVRGY